MRHMQDRIVRGKCGRGKYLFNRSRAAYRKSCRTGGRYIYTRNKGRYGHA